MGEESSKGPADDGKGGCPVKHGETKAECPVKHGEAKSAPACPVKHDGPLGKQYNVYAQPIDPTNQMPFNPNQFPAPGQDKPLPTERVRSFIPKGGSETETWQYPSPQMFYNALVRKGKGDDVDIEQVETIVAVHNNMNERAWNMVVNWEKHLHKDDFDQAGGVRLSRFMGRPDDISPMAWIKSTFFGFPKPFDRHDWVVDRNGKEVRYVIDYYYDEDKSEQDEKPELHDIKSVKSITMDARPAVDSIGSLFDRLRYPMMETMGLIRPVDFKENVGSLAQPQDASSSASQAQGSTTFEDLTYEDLQVYTPIFPTKCASCFEKVNSCATEDECQKSSIALTHCMASLVCKPEATRFSADMSSGEAFDEMVDCMGRFERAALKLRQERNK